jgi:tRNA-uridine aminocarboxypropyltransferase
MHLELCLCPTLVPVDVDTRVVVICHQAEWLKTTNTGRLVPLVLSGGEIRVRGREGQRLVLDDLIDPARQSLVLYPSPGSRLLSRSEVEADGRPVTLVVPDGNWGQARKVTTREPALADMPRVHLPPGPPSRYRLRSHHNPRYVSTLEAVARALGILEGPEVREHLEQVLEVMVERTLYTRGELAAEQVTGGLPRAQAKPPVPRTHANDTEV